MKRFVNSRNVFSAAVKHVNPDLSSHSNPKRLTILVINI